MRLAQVGILVLALAGCTAEPAIAATNSLDLCTSIDALRGHELWIQAPGLVTSHLVAGSAALADVLYEGDAGIACARAECCSVMPYFYELPCAGFSLVFVPAERVDGSAEVDPTTVGATVECPGLTDGSPDGGSCRPDCNAPFAPSPTGRDVLALRGFLPTETSPHATSHLGHPVYVMAVHEVRLPPPVDSSIPPGGADAGVFF